MIANKWFSARTITHYYIIIMMVLFPVWVGNEGYGNLMVHKYSFLLIFTVLWFVLVLLSSFLSKERIRITVDKLIVVFFLIVSFISSLLSPFQNHVWMGHNSYNGFITIVLYAVVYLGVSSFGKPQKLYCYLLIFSLYICSIVSFLQLLGYNPFHLFPKNLTYYDHGLMYSSEFLGNIGNVDLFVALTDFAIPLTICALFDEKGVRLVVMLMFVIGVIFITVYMKVASGFLGLVVGIGMVVFYACKYKRETKSFIIIAIIIGSAVAAAHFDINPQGITIRKDGEYLNYNDKIDASNILNGKADESMGSGRIGIWKATMNSFLDYPILGTGPGTTIDRINIEYKRYVEETHLELKTKVDNAHNEYLEYLLGEGIIGLLLYLFLIIYTVHHAIKKKENVNIIILASLIEYWVQSFFGLGLCIVLPVVYIFWALGNVKAVNNGRQ